LVLVLVSDHAQYYCCLRSRYGAPMLRVQGILEYLLLLHGGLSRPDGGGLFCQSRDHVGSHAVHRVRAGGALLRLLDGDAGDDAEVFGDDGQDGRDRYFQKQLVREHLM
jgi:hypothetical protein